MSIYDLRGWALLVMLSLTGMAGAAQAQNVSVSPQRVVIEHGEKYGEMLVFNSGDEAALVRVSLRNMKMNTGGFLEPVTGGEENLHLADGMIRLAPRQMKIPPKTRQIVRIMAQKPSDLKDGEYRTHVVVTVVPSLEKAQSAISANANQDKNAISLLAITEQVFPAIVRKGRDLTADATIDAARLLTRQDGVPEMAIRFNRSGERSIYGNIAVYFTPAGAAAEKEVGNVKGVAVYREIDSRLVRIPLALDALESAQYRPGGGGHFRIEFDETRGKGERTQASFVIPVQG